MTAVDEVAGVPATERAVVGLCHGLNDQLAAISAYVYLLQRRSQLGDMGEALHTHLDRLAHSVRLVRSLCREHEPEGAPVALSLLAETANELMEAYPEGRVVFVPRDADAGSVVRCDWTRALRSMLIAGAWVSRDVSEPVNVDVWIEETDTTSIRMTAADELPDPPDEPLHEEAGSHGIVLETPGARHVTIHLPA